MSFGVPSLNPIAASRQMTMPRATGSGATAIRPPIEAAQPQKRDSEGRLIDPAAKEHLPSRLGLDLGRAEFVDDLPPTVASEANWGLYGRALGAFAKRFITVEGLDDAQIGRLR